MHPLRRSFVCWVIRIQSELEVESARDSRPPAGNERHAGKLVERCEREVDLADALLNEAIARLSNHCSERVVGETALEDLHRMQPQFQDALAALEEMESRRDLTLKEISEGAPSKCYWKVRRRDNICRRQGVVRRASYQNR